MRRTKNFPSQVVSDEEKLSKEYGLEVARAIENEWFNDSGYNNNRYLTDHIISTDCSPLAYKRNLWKLL